MNKSSSKNVFLRFQYSTLQQLLVATFRDVFRTQSKIYDRAFFENSSHLLAANSFRKKAAWQMLNWVKNMRLAYDFRGN